MTPAELRAERIAEARAAALAALARVTGSDSLCTLARERLPAAKYHEGAVAALGDALRAVRRGGSEPDAHQWGAALAARAADDLSWRAYLTGGRDALTELAAAQHPPTVAPELAPALVPAAPTR